MNYKELERANELYEEVEKVNKIIQTLKDYSSNVKISTGYRFAGMDFDTNFYFKGKHKEKILDTLKEIKTEMIKELNELGVTEV